MKIELEKRRKSTYREPLPRRTEAKSFLPVPNRPIGAVHIEKGELKDSDGKKRQFRSETVRFSNGLAAKHLNRHNASAAAELARGSDEITAVLKTYKNARESQLMGRVAEPHHASTFNANARLRGQTDLTARTTHPHAPVDITVMKGNKVIARAQVKYERTPIRNAASVSKSKYHGQQRVVPSEQVLDVKKITAASSEKATARGQFDKAANRRDAAQRTTGTLEAEGVRSDPLSRKDARDLVRNPNRLRQRGFALEAKGAAKSGAVAGLIGGGIVSSVTNIVQVARGEKDSGAAALDTAKTTVKCGVEGSVVAVGGVVVKRAMVSAGFKGLARSSAPIAVAQLGLEVGSDLIRAAQGEISGEELAKRTGKNVVKGGTSWAFAEGGAALGTVIFPGFGTVVGGIVGGLAGFFLADAVTS